MSSNYLHVSCPSCGMTELVYIGDADLEHFDISEQHISVLCYECGMREADRR